MKQDFITVARTSMVVLNYHRYTIKAKTILQQELFLTLRLANQAGNVVGRQGLVPLDAKRCFEMTDRHVEVGTI